MIIRNSFLGVSSSRPFNPSRLTDWLSEALYSNLWGLSRRKEEQDQVVRRLRRGSENKFNELADKLEGCQPDQRCHSAACVYCSFAFQRMMVPTLVRFLQRQDLATLVCTSVVPEDGVVRPGHLSDADHDRLTRRIKDRLRRAGCGWFVGATDWSFNEHDEDRYPAHWSPHLYGFTATDDPAALKALLRTQFPRTDAIPRPVKVTPWDGEVDAAKYTFKNRFWRRIATDSGTRMGSNGQRRSSRDTDKQPLRSEQKRELLWHLDQIGLSGRLVLKNVQLMNLRESGPTLVLRPPRARRRENGQGPGLRPLSEL